MHDVVTEFMRMLNGMDTSSKQLNLPFMDEPAPSQDDLDLEPISYDIPTVPEPVLHNDSQLLLDVLN